MTDLRNWPSSGECGPTEKKHKAHARSEEIRRGLKTRQTTRRASLKAKLRKKAGSN